MKAHLIVRCSALVAISWIGDAFTNPTKPICHYQNLGIYSTQFTSSRIYAGEDDGENLERHQEPPKTSPDDEIKQRRKEQIGKAAAKIIKRSDNIDDETSSLFNLNPFRAGQNLRKSFDSALTSFARASSTQEERQHSLYYLDSRFKESGGVFAVSNNPYLARLDEEKYVPEVLVIGSTSEVGRLVVKRLLLEGRSRVRVLVRDLYSSTLNILGTGVIYCQGDLNNMDSLEYALTDVDKIIFCEAAPRPDEERFKEKFLGFAQENLDGNGTVVGDVTLSQPAENQGSKPEGENDADMEWERLESVMEVRARLAEQVDFVGMQNLVKAYQNVRHADYGSSQAAKRSLFKFQSRLDDFNLFAIDDAESEGTLSSISSKDDSTNQKPSSGENDKATMQSTRPKQSLAYSATDDPDPYHEYVDTYDKYADEFDSYDDEYLLDDTTNTKLVDNRQDTNVKTQVQWIRNEFGHGVFVGKVPEALNGRGGEASVVSSRLRSRDGKPEDGIDLSGFGGFVCRVCSDGGSYEAFIRTADFDEGVEYVCDFATASKPASKNNASKNKFSTIRLPFESFSPVRRGTVPRDDKAIPRFQGKDVRNIGFRFRSSSNAAAVRPNLNRKGSEMLSFYLGLSYIKLFRTQPEPEFVYLSDGAIPPSVSDGQVRHDIHQLISGKTSSSSSNDGVQILNDKKLQQISSDKTARSPEETYYKYLGEEVLKNSGLSYAIVRVSGYNESPSSEASEISIKSTDESAQSISRREAAEVCVSALLDPCALNKSFYVSKQKGQSSASIDESLTDKFRSLQADEM